MKNTWVICLGNWDNQPKGWLILDRAQDIVEVFAGKGGVAIRYCAEMSLRPTKPTIGRGCESMTPHMGTETRTQLLREAAVRNLVMYRQIHNAVRSEIRNADRSDLALQVDLFHRPPFTIHIAEWLMNQIQVNIIQVQSL